MTADPKPDNAPEESARNAVQDPPPPAPEESEEPPLVAEGMDWYIIRVQSNWESRVHKRLEQRIKSSPFADRFGRVLIPTENVVEIRRGEKKTVKKKKYPGYILTEMALDDDTWFLVSETPGVGDFVGGTKARPEAMDIDEVRSILNADKNKEITEEVIKVDYETGDRVRIKEGPFENFEGVVEDVNSAKGVVSVMVTIFNRATQVDLESWQVERETD